MRDPDLEPQFSWSLALFVTGISFLAFFYVLGKLNENGPRIFLWIGITSLVIALLAAVVTMSMKQKQSSQPDQQDQ